MTFTLIQLFLCIAIAKSQRPVPKSVSQYSIAAARYSTASWYEVMAPAAVALKKDPISLGLTNCETLLGNFSLVRNLYPHPQLEFGLLRHAAQATLKHPFLRRAEVTNNRRAAAGGRDDNSDVLDTNKHLLVHALHAVESVMQVNCESMKPSCAVPSRTIPRQELFESRLARVRCAVLALQDLFKLAAITAGERAIAIGQASALLSFLMLVMALDAINRLR